MQLTKPKTLGDLKSRNSRLPTVREELRHNLISKLKSGEELFPDLVGYSSTVKPDLINALLCGHNMIFLGERGQGKSRIIRNLTQLLDEEIPAVAGCPIHDNPFQPICADCKEKLQKLGDNLPLEYVTRDRRLVEKLATSDVSTADLIGEVDPIKIADGRHLDDESSIHFGLLPRANRSIFAINELPDLAEKIQVAFFNIMEENDLQIKGFPVRLPLDILLIATANPEDYTNRGRIITPLKDRFDVQIRTHYPKQQNHEIKIMEQESRFIELEGIEAYTPPFIKEILAEITFQAPKSTSINQHSGVSCRVSIRGFEAIHGSALRRCLTTGEAKRVPRISDIEMVFPAITGKLEMEYDVEDRTETELLADLSKRAIKTVFNKYFKLDQLASIIQSFETGLQVTASQFQPSREYSQIFDAVPGLADAVQKLVDPTDPAASASAIEFIFEGLHLSNRINRDVVNEEIVYK